MKTEITMKENKFLKEKFYCVHHSSGLDIYVFPKALTTSYALFGTKYGSIDNKFRLKGEENYTEVPDGIAHFLEHKMFENENGEDTFARFAKTGASANAYTSFRMTAYLYSCTGSFYESLEILLDYVTSPYFTPETVEKEQGIIAQEIRMGEDNPERCLLFGQLKGLYEKHNVRLEIAGTVESISKITSDVLYKCYNTFYNLSNMALCVCGDVDPEKVIAVADKILKPQPYIEIESVYAEEKPEVFMPRWEKKMQVSKPLFGIGIKDIDISPDGKERMKKGAAMAILCDMLFGRSSKFFNELYDEGLISASFDCWSIHTSAYSYTSLSDESKSPDEVYGRFQKYIDAVKKEGLSEEVFTRCKRVHFANIVKGFDSTDEIANNFLDYIFNDGDMFDYVDIVSELDFNYINELFYKLYKNEYFALAVINPLDGAAAE